VRGVKLEMSISKECGWNADDFFKYYTGNISHLPPTSPSTLTTSIKTAASTNTYSGNNPSPFSHLVIGV